MSSQNLSRTEQEELARLLEEKLKREKYDKINYLFPKTGKLSREAYKKQLSFISATKTHMIVIVIAGNRSGKTYNANAGLSCMATGDYPDWYDGRKFDYPPKILICGTTNKNVAKVSQQLLLGPLDDLGSGLAPKKHIVMESKRMKPNTGNAIDTISIKHHTNGISDGNTVIDFMTYEQDVTALMGTVYDVILLDEEPPLKFYAQCLKRIMTLSEHGKTGLMMLTFTAESGYTPLVAEFYERCQGYPLDEDDLYIDFIDWDDAPHLTKEQKDRMWKELPVHMRETAKTGRPGVGAGAVFRYPTDTYTCEPFPIPKHFSRFWSLDVGYQHPTACTWYAYDRDNDVLYCVGEYLQANETPAFHAANIKKRGEWIPGIVDPAANQGSKVDGISMTELYKKEGLDLAIAVSKEPEASIMEICLRIESGRFKIFTTCPRTIDQMSKYHRDEDGKIYKLYDDLVDTVKYAARSGIQRGLTHYEVVSYGSYNFNDDNSQGRSSTTGY